MTAVRAMAAALAAACAGLVSAAELAPAAITLHPGEVPRSTARADTAGAWVPDTPPLRTGIVTSGYAARRHHPVVGRALPHWGLDIAAPHGTAVRAAAPGEVVATFRSAAYGIGADVRHGDRFLTRYAHLSALAVRRGERVRRGQRIGAVGSTGRTTGPHLHFEVYARRDGGFRSIDPARLFPPDAPGAP